MAKELFLTTVNLGKYGKKRTESRPGYIDQDGQVYLPRKHAEADWKKKMQQQKGFTFPEGK